MSIQRNNQHTFIHSKQQNVCDIHIPDILETLTKHEEFVPLIFSK